MGVSCVALRLLGDRSPGDFEFIYTFKRELNPYYYYYFMSLLLIFWGHLKRRNNRDGSLGKGEPQPLLYVCFQFQASNGLIQAATFCATSTVRSC